MATVSAPNVTAELIEAVQRAQAAGWTWRAVEDAGGPSSTKMTQILAGEGVVRGDVIRKLDKAFGWDPGTALGLLSGNEAQRRGALTRAGVTPPGQAPSIGRTGRGEGWMPGQREDVLAAVVEMQKAMNTAIEQVIQALQPRDEPEP